MTLPTYKSEQELETSGDLVQRFEPVNANVPNRAHLVNAESRDFLAMYQRIMSTIQFGTAPSLRWDNANSRLEISGSSLELHYTVEDLISAGPVLRKISIVSGSHNLGGGNKIFTVPIGLTADSVVPLGGIDRYVSDEQFRLVLKTIASVSGREATFSRFVFARRVGSSLVLFNGLVLRDLVQVTNGFRDSEYAGDTAFAGLTKIINQDRNLVFIGGGDIEFSIPVATQASIIASLPLKIVMPTGVTITINNLHVGAGVGLTSTDNKIVLGVSLNRDASDFKSAQKYTLAEISSANNNILVLGIWDVANSRFHWVQGSQYRPGDRFPLGLPSAVDPELFIEELVPYLVYETGADALSGPLQLPPATDRVAFVVDAATRREVRIITRDSVQYSDASLFDVEYPSETLLAGEVAVDSVKPLSGDTVFVLDDVGAPGIASMLAVETEEIRLGSGATLPIVDSGLGDTVKLTVNTVETTGNITAGVSLYAEDSVFAITGNISAANGDVLALTGNVVAATDVTAGVDVVAYGNVTATGHVLIGGSAGVAQVRSPEAEFRFMDELASSYRDARLKDLSVGLVGFADTGGDGYHRVRVFAGGDDNLVIYGSVGASATLDIEQVRTDILSSALATITVNPNLDVQGNVRIKSLVTLDRAAAIGLLPEAVTVRPVGAGTEDFTAVNARDIVLSSTGGGTPRIIRNANTTADAIEVRESSAGDLDPVVATNTAHAFCTYEVGVGTAGDFNISLSSVTPPNVVTFTMTRPLAAVAGAVAVATSTDSSISPNPRIFVTDFPGVNTVRVRCYDTAGSGATGDFSLVVFGQGV